MFLTNYRCLKFVQIKSTILYIEVYYIYEIKIDDLLFIFIK